MRSGCSTGVRPAINEQANCKRRGVKAPQFFARPKGCDFDGRGRLKGDLSKFGVASGVLRIACAANVVQLANVRCRFSAVDDLDADLRRKSTFSLTDPIKFDILKKRV